MNEYNNILTREWNLQEEPLTKEICTTEYVFEAQKLFKKVRTNRSQAE